MASSVRSYEGSMPYAFISYSHKDKEYVIPFITQLAQAGYRLWYDGGIEQTAAFSKVIADHIAGCGVFVVFLSKNAMGSEYLYDEVNMAKSLKKTILPIRLDDTPLSNELLLRIGSIEHLDVNKYSNMYQILSEVQKPLYSCYSRPVDQNYINFGMYFTLNRDYEPIKWLPLVRKQGAVLVISNNIIDATVYSAGSSSLWSKSTLRAWLNSTFMQQAFTPEQQSMILSCYLENPRNNMFGNMPDDETTCDMIFCLSINEALEFFKTDASRMSTPTLYASSRGLGSGGFSIQSAKWWLRTPGGAGCSACVMETGYLNRYGNPQNDSCVGVRPVMWLSENALLKRF